MNSIEENRSPDWLAETANSLQPDLCLGLRTPGGELLARAALWWSHSPPDPEDEGRRIGCIGLFDCRDAESGRELLETACARLSEAGCRRAVGPMDGDTWHAYRLVTGGWEESPRFLLETWNDTVPVEAFALAGFEGWARYSSSELALAEPSDAERTRRDRLAERLAARGIALRPMRPEDFEAELEALYELSLEAFAENFLYTPIEPEPFLALYAPVKGLVPLDFVLVAERGTESLGFVFAIPDALRPDLRRLVVKTLAVHPRHRHLGLGTVLVEEAQERARATGFASAIHALQYETNTSLKITKRQAGRAIREYTLFHRPLAERP